MPNPADAVRVDVDDRNTHAPNQVLYVGCPAAERRAVEAELSGANLSVLWADSAAGAAALLQRPNLPVLIDFSASTGFQLSREIRHHRSDALTFAVVPPQQEELTTEALVAGVAEVFVRPLDGRRLFRTIRRELGYRSPAGPAREAVCDDLYTQSPSMQGVVDQIAQAAKRRSGVLVRGERGTGKEVVARAIHAADPASAHGPFVSIDCARIDATDFSAELFGVPARADEDTLPARTLEAISTKSRLHDALGGTLYLRNIDDAPTRFQVRLARLLRDREATVVETGAVVPFNVRCVVGSSADIESAVRDGRVREDLYRRVSNIRVDLPALRDRRQDVPMLANLLVRELCASRRTAPKTLSRAALLLLAALPWRGNADELNGVLEAAVGVSGTSAIVRLDAVLAHVRLDGRGLVAGGGTLRQARAQFEREYITSILAQHRGRITPAAKVLGIQRTNLYRKMRSLSVSKERRV